VFAERALAHEDNAVGAGMFLGCWSATTRSAAVVTHVDLLRVESAQKKQRFFSEIAFHPLFMQVLNNFVIAPTFEIF
jgi:hypothetical protein